MRALKMSINMSIFDKNERSYGLLPKISINNYLTEFPTLNLKIESPLSTLQVISGTGFDGTPRQQYIVYIVHANGIE